LDLNKKIEGKIDEVISLIGSVFHREEIKSTLEANNESMEITIDILQKKKKLEKERKHNQLFNKTKNLV